MVLLRLVVLGRVLGLGHFDGYSDVIELAEVVVLVSLQVQSRVCDAKQSANTRMFSAFQMNLRLLYFFYQHIL